MSNRGLAPTVGRLIDPSEEPTMKKSLAITVAVTAVILIAAFATLAVLTALAGQESGLDRSTAGRCAGSSSALVGGGCQVRE